MRKTIIDVATGDVANVVELADDAAWEPSDGQAVGHNGGEIGQRWNGVSYEWIDPPLSD
ncbi:hypothetical protein [Hyphomicrobium methylovorum]|uniref:hypothetical protein n=1 Tax=Hyphomicrobium methylovorum TaxID=84 RepID=UPI0015E79B35|nr:hypothetical protein [Hyphomicrobium methylovorum]